MEKIQFKNKKKQSNNNISEGGLVSQMLMDTPLMQQKANEHQVMFGRVTQKQNEKDTIKQSDELIQRAINSLDENTYYDSIIYGIIDNNTNKIIYVGQTNQGLFTRFYQHTTDSNENDQPWHIDNYTYDQNNANNWRYFYVELEQCKQFTPLEITASEEFWFEHHGGLTGKLYNRKQPLKKSTFEFYRDNYPNTFRGKAIKFPSDTWTPKQ